MAVPRTVMDFDEKVEELAKSTPKPVVPVAVPVATIEPSGALKVEATQATPGFRLDIASPVKVKPVRSILPCDEVTLAPNRIPIVLVPPLLTPRMTTPLVALRAESTTTPMPVVARERLAEVI